MIKDIVANLSVGTSRDVTTVDAHLTGVARVCGSSFSEALPEES
jgi:hypothetical protein